jgi:hypothetical protein
MNLALPILLLIFGGMTLWILSESRLKWYIKAGCITIFCVFTVIFWSTVHSFLGWPAEEDDMPEKILIHWVIIKEPNKHTKSSGAIYILLESVEQSKDNRLLKFFGYKKDKIEPRLYELKYSRGLHETLQKRVMLKLKSGQPVIGKLSKMKSRKGIGKDGKGDPKQKGDGSESQEQEWFFHRLLPSELQGKPSR